MSEAIERRDLQTGQPATNRTVGYTASIGAQMIGAGQITKRGVLSPVTDVPYEPFVQALATRGVQVSTEVSTG